LEETRCKFKEKWTQIEQDCDQLLNQTQQEDSVISMDEEKSSNALPQELSSSIDEISRQESSIRSDDP
jgi:hypothetical protein